MKYKLVVESEMPLHWMLNKHDFLVISAVEDPDNPAFPGEVNVEVSLVEEVERINE